MVGWVESRAVVGLLRALGEFAPRDPDEFAAAMERVEERVRGLRDDDFEC